MLKFIKFSNKFSCALKNNQRTLHTVKCLVTINNSYVSVNKTFESNNFLKKTDQVRLTLCRYKSKGKKAKPKYGEIEDSDDEEDNEEEEEEINIKGKGYQDKTVSVESLRIDTLLKKALNIGRKKIEVAFYESRLRNNGNIFLKKSLNAKVGDEIDIIKEVAPDNPNFLIVSRVEVLSSKFDSEIALFLVKVRVSKSLLIYNYPDGDSWKSKEENKD